jgi:hypothetical protein
MSDLSTMVIHTSGFGISMGNLADRDLAYVCCADAESNYCLSISRFLHCEAIEIMVKDQINYETPEIEVELSSTQLLVILPRTAAAKLDGITQYIVPLLKHQKVLIEINAALTTIFASGDYGKYISRV